MPAKLTNYPHSPSKPFVSRMILSGTRKNDGDSSQPTETPLIEEKRWIGKGIREKGAKAMFLASYIPLFLATEATLAGDSGGGIVLIVCCVISMYLFSITSWGNEKIK